MLDKKANFWVMYFYLNSNGWKAVETTHNISNTFGPGTANKHTVQWWFKKFCKGEERLEDEEQTGHQKLTMANWAIIKADPLTTIRGVPKEFNVSHSTLIWYLKQIGKVKKLISGCLMSWQKIVILKCHLLLFYTTMNHFLIELWHVMKSGFYMTTSSVHLSGQT